MGDSSKRIAIVTVHGTGDTAQSAAGEKWFQDGSTFTSRLKTRLAQQGIEADVTPFMWTGANSAQARENAADKLADTVKAHAKRYAGVHIVGHSHGGNVANDAADFLRWGRRKKAASERITSLTTVGTPFFRSRTNWFQRFMGWGFLALTLTSTIIVAPIGLYVLALIMSRLASSEANVPNAELYGPIAVGLIFLFTLIFMWRLATTTVRRIRRPRARDQRTRVEIFSMWHPNDEAIAFLQRVEKFPIEAFPRGSWARGARMPAIHWGINTLLLAILISAVAFVSSLVAPAISKAVLEPIRQLGLRTGKLENQLEVLYSIGSNAPFTLIAILILAPVAFYTIYLFRRFFIGTTGDVAVRPLANRGIAGALRGMAFGRDDDQILGQVSTESHTQKTRTVKLEGELALRLQNGAAKAAADLIEKYRWSLFTVGADSNSPLTALATDAMTWNSLIHTSYFDQPEVADMIADHIAEAQRAESGAPAAPAAVQAA